MRILMVTCFYPPYHVGGACTHVYYLANELAKRGHQVDVLFSKDAYFLKRRNRPAKNYKNHSNVSLFPVKTPAGRLTPLFSYITGLIPFSAGIRKVFGRDYDLIHYHNVSLFGPKIFSYGNARKIYTAHDHWLACPLNDLLSNGSVCPGPGRAKCQACLLRHKRPLQLWRLMRPVPDLRDISLVISPSKYLMGFLRRHGIKNRTVLLPNFVPDPPAAEPVQGDYFFYAGMLEESKGIRQLVQVFQKTGQRLVIAGCGSLSGFVRSNAKNNIMYAGWLASGEMYSYYRGAKCFILPSRCNENSPLTILEAMSVGTPSLASERGGIPEILGRLDKRLCFGSWDELLKKVNRFVHPGREKVAAVWKRNYSAGAYIDRYLRLIGSGQ